MIPDLGGITQPTRVWNLALGNTKLNHPRHFSERRKTDSPFQIPKPKQLTDTTHSQPIDPKPNPFFEPSMVFDLLQINQYSLWVDLAITFRSVPCIVKLACLA